MKVFKCPDCDATIEVDDDVEDGNVYSCPDCGLELEYKAGNLVEFTIEGE